MARPPLAMGTHGNITITKRVSGTRGRDSLRRPLPLP